MKRRQRLRRFLPFLMSAIIILLTAFPLTSYGKDITTDAKINSFITDGKYQECIDYLDELIKTEPDNYDYYSKKGYALVKLGKTSEAVVVLEKANTMKPDDDYILNNLGWAENILGNYQEALDYCIKSLAITPEDPVTLCNKGNALRGLNRLAEALVEYDKSLANNPKETYSLYGRGLTEFDLDNFSAAVYSLTNYITIILDDADAYLYLGMSYYNLGDDEKGIEVLEKAIALDPKNTAPYYFKGFCYNDEAKYDEAVKMYDIILGMDPKDSEAYYQRGKSLYYLSNYKESLKDLDMSIELDPNYSYSYYLEAKDYLELKDYTKGMAAVDKAISLDPKNYYAYNTEAKIYYAMGNSSKAFEIVENAIELFPDYSGLLVDKAFMLYDSSRYGECIAFIETLFKNKKFNSDIDLRWYQAQCYSALNNHSDAIKIYQKLTLDFPDNVDINTDLSWEYYYIEDYINAEKLGNISLSLDPTNAGALKLLEDVKYSKLGDNIKITDFVKYNYLYLKTSKDFTTASKILRAKKNATINDIAVFLRKIVNKDDRFTYFIEGKYYTDFVKHENDTHIITTSLKPEVKLIRIPSFAINTGDEVNKYILSLSNTVNTTLVIDLRDNTGGLISGANQILDTLLPNCTTSYLVYSDGSKHSYTSDSNYIKFKKIIIMVNENSASSSELLSLSLKKHLKNVTIIGHKTFGKGVGQETYENKSKKFVILLTSFYWYVENINISRSKITPDVIIKGSKDKDYFNYLSLVK